MNARSVAGFMLLAAASNAWAHDDHPRFTARNMELVGHTSTGTTLADIWVHRRTAYLGSRACGEGVSIVDTSNPASPRLLGHLPADANSTYEDIVVLSVRTPAFTGDLLATGVQPCNARGTKHGVHLWDVSNPTQPVELAFHTTGQRGSVHELFAKQVNGRVLLYLAVPYSERYGEGGDFRIVDATDPRLPVQIADWGVYSRLGLNDEDVRVLGRPVIYCHSVNVSDDGRYAFLSYWDAGYITLDLADPARPVFLSRVPYQPSEEGNAHSTFPLGSRKLLLAADEDYLIGGVEVSVTTPQASTLSASELLFPKAACTLEPVEAEVVIAGQGCATLPQVAGRIAAFEPGGSCSEYDQALAAQKAGAAGFLIARREAVGAPGGGAEAITIPGASIPAEDFNRLRPAAAAVRAKIAPGPDNTWGYLRIFDIADLRSPRQIGTFATENARRCPSTDAGWYTIHNPVVVGNTAYTSWYTDGVRAIDISDPTKPVEIGSFVNTPQPHTAAQPASELNTFNHIEQERGESDPQSFVWGVFVDNGLIYLSDEATGLWIVRLNGTANATSSRGAARAR